MPQAGEYPLKSVFAGPDISTNWHESPAPVPIGCLTRVDPIGQGVKTVQIVLDGLKLVNIADELIILPIDAQAYL
ncbi:hypothetical protein D3C73_1076870 [compost metagenome]